MKARASSDKAPVSTAADTPVETPTGPTLLTLDAPVLQGVNVDLDARLGEVSLSVKALLALKQGSVLTLDRQLNELVELRLNDVVVARGEIVAVDDKFGVRIFEVATRA